ncbi:DUF2515 family protein [Fictibacillus sp. b24]|uniref:DUF2515 family protein n=1 Tax=Fictibacillus sp. b24 TaxID=3055863 RepID=UPI0025A066F8|nr:DUF2515 family protein [Fictibacillus sp. b24]MDM5316154.1 DUF2515 family protein [Fictibacillus sp. b24]
MERAIEEIVHNILSETNSQNRDNISRTVSYASFYKRNPEIRWAMLASLVSRNAGYSMCDLKGDWLPRMLSADTRKHLFLTYERANWLIFQDAFPQLLLYEYSKQQRIPFFHLLKCFGVSRFMEVEWKRFWRERDLKRICTSLIINEQHVIEKPVIKDGFYKRRIFSSVPFLLQDYMHFSTVLFPVESGDVFGISIHGFKKTSNRIETGKILYTILFESKWSEEILSFSNKVTHTGSRHDFERVIYPKKKRETPFLRVAFPVIKHHSSNRVDWYKKNMNTEKFYGAVKPLHKICLTDWYKQKQRQLKIGILLKEWIQHA